MRGWCYEEQVPGADRRRQVRAHRRLRQWHVYGWHCWFLLPRAVFLSVVVRPKMLGIMAGMHQKDIYAARCLHAVVHMPVGCHDRCPFAS